MWFGGVTLEGGKTVGVGFFQLDSFEIKLTLWVSPNWLQLLHESHFGPFIHLISINTSHKNESYPKVPELFLGTYPKVPEQILLQFVLECFLFKLQPLQGQRIID